MRCAAAGSARNATGVQAAHCPTAPPLPHAKREKKSVHGELFAGVKLLLLRPGEEAAALLTITVTH